LLKVVIVAVLTTSLLCGCSEKQKEAARLGQEVKDLEDSGTTDTTQPESVLTGSDTLLASPAPADAAAIPPEAQAGITPLQPMPPPPSIAGWTVQVASCESQDYARRLVDVFTRRGYQPFVTTITKDGQLYYRVRIGSFTDLAESRKLRNELVDRYSVQAWIDRIER